MLRILLHGTCVRHAVALGYLCRPGGPDGAGQAEAGPERARRTSAIQRATYQATGEIDHIVRFAMLDRWLFKLYTCRYCQR